MSAFRHNKLAIEDGGKKVFTNGELADQANEMLNILPDRAANEERENVVDALANMMHYCHREKIDFAGCVQSAEMHFEAEK